MSARPLSLLCLAAACSLPRFDSLIADDAAPNVAVISAAAQSEPTSRENLPLIVPAPVTKAVQPRSTQTLQSRAADSTESASPPDSARESASRRAREEWQKQQLAAANQTRNQKQKADEASPAKKRKTKAAAASESSEKKPAAKQTAKSELLKSLPEIVPQPVRLPRYIDVYRSIPFSRAEYDADPNYRHNGTLELLLNQLRPSAPRIEPTVNVTVRPLDPYTWSIPVRSGYRPWSKYPWH
ncbi:hypothetical protein GC176_16055 [bacterium]|nr:hypothetical protein [bacterium]